MTLARGAVASDQGDGHGDGGSESESFGVAPSYAASAIVGSVNLGPLCPADFKVRSGAAEVYEEIVQFGTPPLTQELFWKMSLEDML